MPRHRKPTADLKLHAGKVYASRHGDRSLEPQPTGKPVRPAGMSDDAKAHWDAIVPSLIETGVATAQDTTSLAKMCEFDAEYQRAKRKTAKDRTRLLMMVAAHKEWINLAARFGLTPSDRARIVSDGTNQKRSKTAGHLT